MTFNKIFLSIATLMALSAATVSAFTTVHSSSSTLSRLGPLHAYVPAGLTAAQYSQIKQKDKKALGKNLGALGPRGFKSRSMQSWQEAFERGETGHSIAPFGYKQALAEGKMKKQDVPYMVRGGNWDNSDVSGAKRKRWLRSDREYANGGYKKQQSVSILGGGPGFDWAGTRERQRVSNLPGLS